MKRTMVLAALLASAGSVYADDNVLFETQSPGHGDSLDESEDLVQKTMKVVRVWEDQQPDVQYLVNSNIVYLHRCKGNSCTVARGSTNSSMSPDQSSIVCRPGTPCGDAGVGTLTPFSRSEQVWSETLACVKEVFAPFNVVITDQDPGQMPHYEIMVGGTPTQLGFDLGTGGVSPATCGTIPSSLVFVFDVWGNNVNELCATAAQEIAHSWALDHVTDPSDPMTYYAYANRRHFKDADVTCGSDCSNGYGPTGEACTGTAKQTRECSCGTGPTQNSVEMLRSLFGDGTPTPPTVAITNPREGQSVTAGFKVVADVTDDMGISRVELYIDGRLHKTLTAAPWHFGVPDDLTMGSHELKVIAYDIVNTPTTAISSAMMTPPCATDSECPAETDLCVNSRCIPGPSFDGGLGASCTDAVDCASGSCATTTDGAYCVEPCMLNQAQCPDGFGCLAAGDEAGMGVCFPGYDENGGCNAGGNGAGVTLGLAFVSLLFGRRRRRS